MYLRGSERPAWPGTDNTMKGGGRLQRRRGWQGVDPAALWAVVRTFAFILVQVRRCEALRSFEGKRRVMERRVS